MFCFFKRKCLLFVYLYAVVIVAGLSVSTLQRYGKQGCLGRISGGSGSMRDAFCTTLKFGHNRQLQKPSGYAGSEWCCMHLYTDHRQACPFERFSLYSGWLRYGPRMVRYLSERVLRQFERVQTIPRHPVESASPVINLAEITNRFQHALDHALTPEQLGQHAVHGVDAVEGYIEWFYHHSHPRMVLPDIPVPVPRPLECEVLDARAVAEDGEQG